MSFSIPLNTPDCKNQNGAKRLKILSTSGFTNSCTEIMLESKFTRKFSCVILTKLTILSTMAYYCLLPLREKTLLHTLLVRGRWYFIMSSSQNRLGKQTHHRSVLKKKCYWYGSSQKKLLVQEVQNHIKSQIGPDLYGLFIPTLTSKKG